MSSAVIPVRILLECHTAVARNFLANGKTASRHYRTFSANGLMWLPSLAATTAETLQKRRPNPKSEPFSLRNLEPPHTWQTVAGSFGPIPFGGGFILRPRRAFRFVCCF